MISESIVRRLADVLEGFLSMRRGDERHLPLCRIGQWLDGYGAPAGAPCSKRCLAARQVVAEARALLALHEPRQIPLEAAS